MWIHPLFLQFTTKTVKTLCIQNIHNCNGATVYQNRSKIDTNLNKISFLGVPIFFRLFRCPPIIVCIEILGFWYSLLIPGYKKSSAELRTSCAPLLFESARGQTNLIFLLADELVPHLCMSDKIVIFPLAGGVVEANYVFKSVHCIP